MNEVGILKENNSDIYHSQDTNTFEVTIYTRFVFETMVIALKFMKNKKEILKDFNKLMKKWEEKSLN